MAYSPSAAYYCAACGMINSHSISCPYLGLGQGQNVQPSPRLPEPEETCVFAITGWRRWFTPMFEEVLLSNNRTIWVPYEKLEARCIPAGPTAPSETITNCSGVTCHCGIYAYKKQQDAEWGENRPETDNHIWGEVWLWGRVVEHQTGYRAQYAYPKSLVDTGGIARRLATIYGCEVIVVTPTERPQRAQSVHGSYLYFNAQGQIAAVPQPPANAAANNIIPQGLYGLVSGKL